MLASIVATPALLLPHVPARAPAPVLCTSAPPDFLKELGITPKATPFAQDDDAVEPTTIAEAVEAVEKEPKKKPFSIHTSEQPAFDVETSTHGALDQALAGEVDDATMYRSVLAGWMNETSKDATIARLAEFEDGFDGGRDTAIIKDQLIGTWKLLFTSEPNGAPASGGVSGMSATPYSRVVAQYQSFRKPDPMDILTGNTEFMETTEVIINVKEGSSAVATVKGGFRVDPPSDDDASDGTQAMVTEYYSKRGAEETTDVPPNDWGCAFVSDELRICRLPDGGRRTYAKVDPAQAQAEVARLRALAVERDAAAASHFEAMEALRKAMMNTEPEEDPNDDRPIWQKRLDEEAKRDGRYNGAQGKPPPTSGGPP